MDILDDNNVAEAATDTALPVASEPAEPLSIRDQLKSAMQKADQPAEAKSDRPRDEAGRFAPKEGEQADKPAEKAADAIKPGAQAQTPDAANVAPVAAPPASWAAEAKAAFAQLPPAVQAAVAKREAEVEKGFAILQDYKGLDEFTPILRQAGRTHAEVMQKAISWERALQTNPVPTVLAAARQGKVDMYALAKEIVAYHEKNPTQAAPQGQPPQQQAPVFDPSLIDQKVEAKLRQKEIESKVDAFFNDPSRPHARAVENRMAALIKTGEASTLEDAYEMAIWADPNIRQQLISEQQAASIQKEPPKAVQAADQARRASRSIAGSASAGASASPKGPAPSLREELRAQMRAAQGV